MNDAWKTFLVQQGAVFYDGSPPHFGNPQSERRATVQGNVLADLSSLSLIRASGPEAKAFLNGQLTNELNLIDAGHHRLAAWCSAQGRMLAVFRIFVWEGNYYLQLPTALRDEAIKRLRMFVLRAKVTIENADTDLVRLGLVGPTAATVLRDAVGAVPENDDACVTHGAFTLLRLPGVQQRFEIVAPVTEAISLWEKLRPNATPVGFGVWSWHDIMAGLPTVHLETKEAFVPQMANLELVGGVNFKKGCYPGQEIVARMQYLGRLKQRMYRAHVAADASAPGTAIFAPEVPGQSVGTVVDAQLSPDTGIDLLAVIQTASVQAGELHLGSATGPLLEIQRLPYSLTTPE